MTTKRKVTFSGVIKTVSNQGEIRYEQDARSPSNQPVEDYRFENFDFLQHQIEELFPFGGDEYEDHVNMLSMPFFQCNRTAEVKRIGAVEYLKALAGNPPNGVTSTDGIGSLPPTGPVAVELPKKKVDGKDNKKRGVIRPKDIPGRDTPEQRKLRLIGTGKTRVSLSKPSAPIVSNDRKTPLTPKSIMKVAKKEHGDVVVADLPSKPTCPPLKKSVQDSQEETRSLKEVAVGSDKESSPPLPEQEEREQPDTSEPPAISVKESQDSPAIQRRNDRYSPASRDPPSADELIQDHVRNSSCPGTDDFRPRITSPRYRPDPSALYSSEDMYRPGSMPSMNYTRPPTVTTSWQPTRILPSE